METSLTQADAVGRLNVSHIVSIDSEISFNPKIQFRKTCSSTGGCGSRSLTCYNPSAEDLFLALSARRKRFFILCLSSFQIISLQQGRKYWLRRSVEVFIIKDCMQEDQLCASLLIDDREVPAYIERESYRSLYQVQMSPNLLWRVIQVRR
ncbi:hypothetical protein AVEN_188692-1 [Araneus ventricosus]|uniref:Uncharacterized protein n=1 Tax=Araneus ventricosus TaxID=182803 RepID=A0A4Y2D8S2_ARAVE|nr:hypothetical protein AVEN_188692-1 [Araneus ventricosus]